jgi:hypothetical protein
VPSATAYTPPIDLIALGVLRVSGEEPVLRVGLLEVDGVALREIQLAVDRQHRPGVPRGVTTSVGADIALTHQRCRKHRQRATVHCGRGQLLGELPLPARQRSPGQLHAVCQLLRHLFLIGQRHVHENQCGLAGLQHVGRIPRTRRIHPMLQRRGVALADLLAVGAEHGHVSDRHLAGGEVGDP